MRIQQEHHLPFSTCSKPHFSLRRMQIIQSCPLRFGASLPLRKLIFHQELAINLTWLKIIPVLQVIEMHKNFRSTTVFGGKSALDILYAFVECMVRLCVGYLRKIRFDQKTLATSEIFRDLDSVHSFEL